MLKIVLAPDPALRKTCDPLEQVDSHHQKLIKEMFETMYEANGVGLAAPQVGVNKRIFIIDAGIREEIKNPIAMINPIITNIKKNISIYEEGCLSFPGHYAELERPDEITVEYLDEYNKKQRLITKDFTSRVIQHELDHINGILFIDHLSRLKRDIIIKKMKRHKKELNKSE
jgi:peptide deformylase|tara:strand:- start:239 stop:754 length:516 start_codon:yes stop_codon:yes gene_type:complete